MNKILLFAAALVAAAVPALAQQVIYDPAQLRMTELEGRPYYGVVCHQAGQKIIDLAHLGVVRQWHDGANAVRRIEVKSGRYGEWQVLDISADTSCNVYPHN